MYLTVRNQLRGLSATEYETLRVLCRLSKNLYNEALYSVRQYYFTEHKFLRYESNYHVCKSSENYAALHTDIAQQTMKYVDRGFKSFLALLNKARTGTYRFDQAHIPHYLPQDGFFDLIIPRAKIEDGFFAVPMSRSFKKEHGVVKLPVPEILRDKKIKEIRIKPYDEARYFVAEYVYKQPEYQHDLDTSKFLGIDLGLDNLATCATNSGASFILDGKQLKSYNRLYNKENARLQSIKDKQGIKTFTHRQFLNLRKRNRRIDYGMSVAAAHIVRYCIESRIGNIVVGRNIGWKHEIHIGKQSDQNFAQIPHGKLRKKLEYLCELHGIRYIEQEESYTSKASFFDDDFIPTYKPGNDTKYKFSGRRITRGQYRDSRKYIFNADVNGALNILRKCTLVDLTALQHSGCVSQPCRVRLF